jgi:hypothetical protein
MFNGTYHWTYNDVHISQNHKVYLTESSQPYDLSANWTTFGLEWDTAVIRWYVNNVLVKELDLTRIPPFCLESDGYTRPEVPFCIRFNSGNNTVGNQSTVADPAGFPQAMLIDYVRIYQKAGHKACPVVIRDGLPQICATATSPADSAKFIHAPYYPGVDYQWTADAFELQDIALPRPQPPGRKLVWIKPGVEPGKTYPISVKATFPDGYMESDTANIIIAQGPPAIPAGDFTAFQVGSLCRFAISSPVTQDITAADYSLDNGVSWDQADIFPEGIGQICRFGEFQPGQQVSFRLREQNSCGYSPEATATLVMPAPPTGCTWPAGITDPGNHIRNAVTFAPNPVRNTLTIRVNEPVDLEKSTVTAVVLDMDARQVMAKILTDRSTEIDLSFLRSGVYCLRLTEGSASLFRTLFIKY